MNERIKELADQAGINSVVPVKGSLEYVSKDEVESLKKFAELIVRECVDIALKVDKNPYLEDHYHARQIIKNINKHFGVE